MLLQLLKSFVLRRKAALAGRIDHEQHLPRIGVKGLFLAAGALKNDFGKLDDMAVSNGSGQVYAPEPRPARPALETGLSQAR